MEIRAVWIRNKNVASVVIDSLDQMNKFLPLS